MPCCGGEIGVWVFLMASVCASLVELFWPWSVLAERASCPLLAELRKRRVVVNIVFAPVICFNISSISAT